MNESQLQTNIAADDEFARALEIVENTVIKPIVRRKLHVSLSKDDAGKRNQDAIELVSDIRLTLISELHQTARSNGGIRNIPSYAATIAYNTCYQHFRSRYPLRTSLRNKIRYLLTHHHEFALWRDSAGRWLCGLAAWDGELEHFVSPPDGEDLARIGADRQSSADIIRAYFDKCDGPILLDDLVNLTASASGLIEPAECMESSFGSHDGIADPALRVDAVLELTSRLRLLWGAVVELPAAHRKALLLNLSDTSGENLLTALPLTGVATIAKIACALEMSTEELAQIWNSLPWEDYRIAEHLGLTRQQVINLRQTARSKLARWRKGTGNI